MNKFHLILIDGSERDIMGEEAIVTIGTLTIKDTDGESTVIYAPGTWLLCELERKDDRS